MSYHKARPDVAEPNPTAPASIVYAGGRAAVPHANVNGKPLLGGIQNSNVEVPVETEEEKKDKIEEYHAKREEVKKTAKETFDDKTGKPKVPVVSLEANPVLDSKGTEKK